ncbi:hypothetical protein MPSEU_000390700 [Mayamaea pseudoterrestris]|nr:hypothetical protein MPSEU_000390700 [Mayamaea pseudoterrestris]
MTGLYVLFCMLYGLTNCQGQYLYKDIPNANDYVREYEGVEPTDFFDFQSPGIVEFYSPHCAHCRQFTTTYVEIAKATRQVNSNINFYAVSCGSHLEYCRKVDIKGYPSFFKITGGGGNDLQSVKSGTRGVDHTFVLSLFDKNAAAVEDTPTNFQTAMTALKLQTNRTYIRPALNRIGPGRLNPQTNKVEEVPSTGATVSMKANIKGTSEEMQRRATILESIRRAKGQRKAEQVKSVMETTSELPYQKLVPLTGLREKIPLFRRTVKLSLEEELIIDTAVSFAYSLKYEVFLRGQELSESETKALKNWLILLSVSLPQEWILTTLVDDVLRNVDGLVKNPALLDHIMKDRQIVRTAWSPSCRRVVGGGGYTCGFWKLLHTVTVGVAEHRGGKTVFAQSSNTFSPAETADIIRDFIANFFRCRTCAAHFIASYDDCSFDRCDRLVEDAEATSDSDWKEVAVWLWKFHNAVNIRVWNERNENGVRKSGDELKLVWPSLADCWTCYRGDGSWDQDAVFLHLERSYWPDAEIDSRTARLLTFSSQIQPPNAIRIYALICILIVLVGYRSASPYIKGQIYGPKRSD